MGHPNISHRTIGAAGKGSAQRPCFKQKSIMDLRHDLAFGKPEQKLEAAKALYKAGELTKEQYKAIQTQNK